MIKDGARISSYNVTIPPGVAIKENAAIGAEAVVTRDMPDNCLAVGVPSKPVSYHNFLQVHMNSLRSEPKSAPQNRQMHALVEKTCVFID